MAGRAAGSHATGRTAGTHVRCARTSPPTKPPNRRPRLLAFTVLDERELCVLYIENTLPLSGSDYSLTAAPQHAKSPRSRFRTPNAEHANTRTHARTQPCAVNIYFILAAVCAILFAIMDENGPPGRCHIAPATPLQCVCVCACKVVHRGMAVRERLHACVRARHISPVSERCERYIVHYLSANRAHTQFGLLHNKWAYGTWIIVFRGCALCEWFLWRCVLR